MPINVTIWNEGRHEQEHPAVQAVYPDGIHHAIEQGLTAHLGNQITTQTALLDDPDQGLPEDLLNKTDVLLWWSHIAHDEVDDALVTRIQQRVLEGMGLLVLHSSHFAKIFKRLMGTGCGLKWREAGERERVWSVNPAHPITNGLPESFIVPQSEMYSEFFDIPQPDELVFLSWYQGGNVFRSGCCWTRGKGRIFYFGPGHETYPIYFQSEIRQILANAVLWAAPQSGSPYIPGAPNAKDPLEEL